jgi:hypothetical protein
VAHSTARRIRYPSSLLGEIAAIGSFAQIARQVLGADAMMSADEQALMLLNRVWMIRKQAEALALSFWTTSVCVKCSPRSASRPR